MDATAIALRTRLACRLRCQEIEHVPVTFNRQKEAHLINRFNAVRGILLNLSGEIGGYQLVPSAVRARPDLLR